MTEDVKVDQYLLGEMSESERERFEENMLASDALYYSVADRENELVDRYVRDSLDADLTTRFQHSLPLFPARKQKLANAEMLRNYVADARQDAKSSAASIPWYQRLGFAFKAPAFATAAIGLLLLGTIAFLLVQNRNTNNQVANASELQELRRRESELQATLDTERSTSGDLTSDLESEREQRAKLENELAELRKKISNTQPPANDIPMAPTIATLVLRPSGIRGGPNPPRRLEIPQNAKRVAVKLTLPAEEPVGNVNVQLNGETITQKQKPAQDANGGQSVSFSVPSAKFNNGLNRITVLDPSGKQIVEYVVMKENK